MDQTEKEEQEIASYLGLDRKEIPERFAQFPTFIMKRTVKDQETAPTDVVDFVKVEYSYNELVYFTIMHLTEKTCRIIESPEGQAAMIDMLKKFK